MSDGHEERAEQEARREWEKTRRSESQDAPRDYETRRGRRTQRIVGKRSLCAYCWRGIYQFTCAGNGTRMESTCTIFVLTPPWPSATLKVFLPKYRSTAAARPPPDKKRNKNLLPGGQIFQEYFLHDLASPPAHHLDVLCCRRDHASHTSGTSSACADCCNGQCEVGRMHGCGHRLSIQRASRYPEISWRWSIPSLWARSSP